MTQATRKRLVAVVVTFNRLAKLKVTVARLLDSPAQDLAGVVIVNNASSDGTAEWLDTLVDPRLRVIHETTNLGGAGGFDRGMRAAVVQFDPDWIVVMDDDGRPEPGALAEFQSSDMSDWDALAAAVYLPDGQICDMNRPSRNPFWNLRVFFQTVRQGRSGFHLDPQAYTDARPQPIDVTSFVGFFISRRGIELGGYPDPALFLYGDDGLYTLRLVARGGRMCFDPRIRFEHDLSTFAGDDRRFRPLWKAYYYHRNLLLLYRQAAGWMFWPALLIIIPKWLAKTRAHRGEARCFAGLILRAIRDGLLQRINVTHAQVVAWGRSGER